MRALRRPAAAAALLLALAGCGVLSGGTPPAAAPASAVARATVPGGRFLALVGPRRQHDPPFLGVPGTNFYALRTWLDAKSGERVTQLYVEDSYFGAERHYDAAYDAAGRKLKFIAISNNEITCHNGACSYAEEFAAELPESLLRANAGGLTVLFTAKSGAPLAIAVPRELIEKQLAALDAARSARPTTAAAASPPSH